MDGWMVDGWMVDGWMVDGWMVDGWIKDGYCTLAGAEDLGIDLHTYDSRYQYLTLFIRTIVIIPLLLATVFRARRYPSYCQQTRSDSEDDDDDRSFLLSPWIMIQKTCTHAEY